MSDEVLTPIGIERKLVQLVSALTRAQQALVAAREAEVAAWVALKRGEDAAAAKAPPVERGVLTVGEREALIERAVRDQWEAHVRAEAARKSAEDYLRVLRDQLSAVQSLGASVRVAYQHAGTGASQL